LTLDIDVPCRLPPAVNFSKEVAAEEKQDILLQSDLQRRLVISLPHRGIHRTLGTMAPSALIQSPPR
jgi:hypothetical protein